jgi:hypothetical protein
MTSTLTKFHVHAIPADAAQEARRRAGTDEHHEYRAEDAGVPLRCCLRHSRPGEAVVLFRYTPSAGAGPYEESGPVFIHAEPCAGPERVDEYPADLHTSPRVIRAYNAKGQIHGGGLAVPSRREEVVNELFGDPEVAVIQVRSLSHGCFLFAISRA